MRIYFALVFILLLLSQKGFGFNIREYSYQEMKEYIKGSTSFSEFEKQADIDKILENKLGINFVYIDLSECLKYALRDNYEIKIKEALSKQKNWNYRNSIVKILPNVHYDYSRQDLKGEFLVGGIVPVGVHEIATNLYLNVEWDWFKKGKYFFDLFQNKYLYKSAQAQKKFSVDETLLKTSIAYYNLLEAKLEIEAYRTNLFELKYYKDIAEARYKAGLDRKYDLKRAEADLAAAERNYETGINSLRLKQAELAAIMGIEVFYPVYPNEITVNQREIINKDLSLAELYFMAEKSREDIKSMTAQIKADEIKKHSNYSDILPDFTLSYQEGYAGTRRTGLRENSSLRFNATISLGKNALAGTITQIKADGEYLKSQKLRLEQKKQEIKSAILTAYLARENAFVGIEASEKELAAAQESLKIAIESYKAGESSFTDVLDAQSVKTNAKLSVVKNTIDYNKSQIQLLFESGIISYCAILADYSQNNS